MSFVGRIIISVKVLLAIVLLGACGDSPAPNKVDTGDKEVVSDPSTAKSAPSDVSSTPDDTTTPNDNVEIGVEESQEEFFKRFAKYLDAGDEDEFFDNCFARSKPEIRNMYRNYGEPSNTLDSDVETLYTMLTTNEGRLMTYFSLYGTEKWSEFRIQSMLRKNLPKKDKAGNIVDVEPGYKRAEFLYNVISPLGKGFQLRFYVADLNTGKWKFYRKPDVIPN